MQGPMQSWPLTVDRILDYAATWRPQGEVLTAAVKGAPSRATYAQIGARARRLAAALATLGLKRGDVAGVIGPNSTRQLEAWYAIMGMGGVCHPIKPDLPEETIAALLAMGGDKVVFVDPALLSAVEPALRHAPAVEHVIILGEEPRGGQASIKDVLCHETLIRKAGAVEAWGGSEENDPAVLLHTAGASGAAKGVVWSHRSCVLQAMTALGPEGLGLSSQEAVMPLIPFWRAAGWGLAFSGPLSGAKLVFAGAQTGAQAVRVLLDREAVSLAVASPADLQALYAKYREEGRRPYRLTRVVAAGGFCPPALAKAWQSSFGVDLKSAWGLTETSAMGAVWNPLNGEARPPFGLELEIVDAEGQPAPHDGVAIGRLQARGALAVRGHLGGPGSSADLPIDTGDLASIDPDGRIRLMGRADETVSAGKAPVPAGQIESAALAHPATAEAAVIDAPQSMGLSGPLLIVQRREGATAGKAEYLRWVGGRIGSELAPAEVLFVDGLPHDAFGRVDKRILREKLDRLAPRIAASTPAPVPEPDPAASEAEQEEAAPAIPALMAAGEVIYEPPPPASVEPPKPDPTEPQPLIEIEAEEDVAEASIATSESATDVSQAQEMSEILQGSGELGEASLEGDAGEEAAEPLSNADVPEPTPALIEQPEPLLFVAIEPSNPRKRRRKARPGEPERRSRGAPSAARIYLSSAAILACLPALIVASGLAAARLGLADWRYGLHEMLYEWPLRIALVGVVTGAVAVFVGLNVGLRAVWRRAAISLVLPLLTLGALIGVRAYSESFPPLHDVATDWADPIRLSQSLMQARGPDANPVDDDPIIASSGGAYMNRRVAEVDADTCPSAQPVFLPVPPDQAFARAKAALQSEGLQIVTDDLAAGQVEAVAQDLWLGFADDTAIRIRSDPKGARVDLRSVSREGQNDLGANCRRVTKLIQAIQGSGTD
jgi:fatty-acyl-CoA synthase